jgi:hypothetical protein
MTTDAAGIRSRAVLFWHVALRVIAVLNLALWTLSAAARDRRDAACTMQLLLSAAYVAGCAFRSFLPVVDIPRIVLVDSRLSSVIVGRSVATVAELCFAAQWVIMLQRLAGGDLRVQALAGAIVPLIALAEGFSWYAVLTTRQRPHAVENSLWGLSAALVVGGMLVIGPQRLAALYTPVIAGGVAYVGFIFLYDVPMYWSRWRMDEARRRTYLTVGAGLLDVRSRWTVSFRWRDWSEELLWMSLYFTFGVWSSIWLVHVCAVAGAGR